jgi:hypothetical protein
MEDPLTVVQQVAYATHVQAQLAERVHNCIRDLVPDVYRQVLLRPLVGFEISRDARLIPSR